MLRNLTGIRFYAKRNRDMFFKDNLVFLSPCAVTTYRNKITPLILAILNIWVSVV